MSDHAKVAATLVEVLRMLVNVGDKVHAIHYTFEPSALTDDEARTLFKSVESALDMFDGYNGELGEEPGVVTILEGLYDELYRE